MHVAVFRHRDDPGGPGNVVAVQVPETPRALFNEALRNARRFRARILIVADTPEQVSRAVGRVEHRCPHHRRVPYERAAAGEFGPLS